MGCERRAVTGNARKRRGRGAERKKEFLVDRII